MGYKVRSRREDAASNFYMQQVTRRLYITLNRKRHYFVLFGAAKLSGSLQQISTARRSTEPSSLVHRRQWPYLDIIMITEPLDVSKSARIPAVHGKSAWDSRPSSRRACTCILKAITCWRVQRSNSLDYALSRKITHTVAHIHARSHTHTHAHSLTKSCSHTHAQAHSLTHTHTFTHTHNDMYACIYTHTHTYVLAC